MGINTGRAVNASSASDGEKVAACEADVSLVCSGRLQSWLQGSLASMAHGCGWRQPLTTGGEVALVKWEMNSLIRSAVEQGVTWCTELAWLFISGMAARGGIEHATEIAAADLSDFLLRETLLQHLFHDGIIESDFLVSPRLVCPLADSSAPTAGPGPALTSIGPSTKPICFPAGDTKSMVDNINHEARNG